MAIEDLLSRVVFDEYGEIAQYTTTKGLVRHGEAAGKSFKSALSTYYRYHPEETLKAEQQYQQEQPRVETPIKQLSYEQKAALADAERQADLLASFGRTEAASFMRSEIKSAKEIYGESATANALLSAAEQGYYVTRPYDWYKYSHHDGEAGADIFVGLWQNAFEDALYDESGSQADAVFTPYEGTEDVFFGDEDE